ncbi:hypothetical protein ABBQ38_012333 [Trebouxia sp. C0009 RCD-2024]
MCVAADDTEKALDSIYYRRASDSKLEKSMKLHKELHYSTGGSSNTATAVSGIDGEAEGTANSLVSSQQDISQVEIRYSNACMHKKKRGRKGRARGSKRKGIAKKASKAGQATGVRRESGPKAPPSPPELQELAPRESPKKMWPEEEVRMGIRRARRQSPAKEEEEDDSMDDYTDDSSSAVREVRKQGRARHPKEQRKKKEGGPCAICGVTETPAWRRGAQGGPYAGQHLCNRCGVDRFRHPDPVEEGRVKAVRGRRRVTVSRRLNNPVRAESEQPLPQADWRALAGMPFRLATAPGVPPLFKDSCVPTAADTAAAAADSTISQVQRWQSSGGEVARVPANSSMQLWAASECADMDQSPDSNGEGVVQRGRGRGSRLCRKRLAEATTEQPSNKKWRLQAHPESAGSMGQQHSSWWTADAAGNSSWKAGRDASEGGLALTSNHAGVGVSSPAATRFHWFLEKMDQLASRVI